MKYNFDEIIDRRNTNALNTDGFRGYIFHAGPEMKFPYADDEFVRMWVADMEFATPPEICEAIDFDDFAKKAADPLVKLVLWCNPHNPSGRMWTEEELKRVAEIVEKHNLWLISDEIHCDIIRNGRKHIPMGKVMPDYGKLITCMSASKTFNMAGLMFSDIIIRDAQLRKIFCKRDKIVGFVNPLSVAAHQAAYEKCDEWLAEFKTYLDENFMFVKEYLAEHLPAAVFSVPEATYLAWVNLKGCLPDVADLPGFFANNAGVLLEGGNDLFVGNAEGYVRLNLAMPRSIIKTGLERMTEAIEKHNK